MPRSFVEETWLQRLEEKRRAPEEPLGHWASNVGHPCLFYLWANRALWEQAVMPEPTRLAIYDLGNFYEDFTKEKLADAGFEVLEAQALIVDEELNVRGRCDGRIRTGREGAPEVLTRRKGWLVEIKGINSHDWDKLSKVEDLLASSKPWVRLWPVQLGFYVDRSGDKEGGFIFVNKLTGEPKLVSLTLEGKKNAVRDELEAACNRIRRVNGYLALGREAPPLAEFDPLWCQRCDWSHVCPTAARFEGSGEAKVMKSDHFDELLGEVVATEDHGKAYSSNRAAVKKILDDAKVWPEKDGTTVLVTDAFTLALETKGGRHYWNIQTERSAP